jgi:hypothetical protein
MTDEEIWAMWRESLDVHSMEVDMAFARKIEQAAIKAEREACARVAETVPLESFCSVPSMAMLAKNRADVAAAIRARSQP